MKNNFLIRERFSENADQFDALLNELLDENELLRKKQEFLDDDSITIQNDFIEATLIMMWREVKQVDSRDVWIRISHQLSAINLLLCSSMREADNDYFFLMNIADTRFLMAVDAES
ncbi:MAG: hypothetical protein KAS57_03890 [Gammaproteobacteria bacterium]|nr:hypothetical protein [Gammaproteobacteria bacterium]